MSVSEYIKYLTQEVIAYVDSPAKERKLRKLETKTERPFYSNHWFGIVPFAIKSFFKK